MVPHRAELLLVPDDQHHGDIQDPGNGLGHWHSDDLILWDSWSRGAGQSQGAGQSNAGDPAHREVR